MVKSSHLPLFVLKLNDEEITFFTTTLLSFSHYKFGLLILFQVFHSDLLFSIFGDQQKISRGDLLYSSIPV